MGHGGLVVNWQVFGSSGLKVRVRAPAAGVRCGVGHAGCVPTAVLLHRPAHLWLQLRPKGNSMMSYWRCNPQNHPGAAPTLPGGHAACPSIH